MQPDRLDQAMCNNEPMTYALTPRLDDCDETHRCPTCKHPVVRGDEGWVHRGD